MWELLALVGLLIVLAFSQDENPEKAIIAKVKSLGVAYFTFLLKCAFAAIVLPALLLACGVLFKAPACFVLASIMLCILTGLLLLSFTPIVLLIQAFLSLKKEGTKIQQESLAKRWMNGILTVLSFECLITLYFMIVPVANNPTYIALLAMCILLFIFYALRNRQRAGNAIRKFSGITLVVLFVFCTLSFLLPQTIAGIQGSVARFDSEIRRHISGLTDFEKKRELENQRKIAEANTLAQQKAEQAERERRARIAAERARNDEEARAQNAEFEAQRQARRAAEIQRQAKVRAAEIEKRELAKRLRLERENREKVQAQERQMALLQQEAVKYQSWSEWQSVTLKAKNRKSVDLTWVNPKDSIEILFSCKDRRYQLFGYWYDAYWWGCEELPEGVYPGSDLPLNTFPPFSAVMQFENHNTAFTFEKSKDDDSAFRFTLEGLDITRPALIQMLNNIPTETTVKAKGEMKIQFRIKQYRE